MLIPFDGFSLFNINFLRLQLFHLSKHIINFVP